MNTAQIRQHINDLIAELSQLNGNGGLLPDTNSQDVQLLRKKIRELHDRLTVLEHLLEYPPPAPVSAPVDGINTSPLGNPTLKTTVKKKDLKSSIGLNDRFRFVNELFGGNSPEFNAAVDQLESMENKDEAEDYLDRLSGVYHWDKSGPAYSDFLQLVHRALNL